jgi:hypothetical protein
MPRKSVYFPDEQWPRIERAAELEDRSVSKFIQRGMDRYLMSIEDLHRDRQTEAGTNWRVSSTVLRDPDLRGGSVECEVCGAGPTGRCDPPDSFAGDCPHGCSPER